MSKKAVVYTRVSSQEQTENFSLPTQRKACQEWAERHGYKVIRLFEDRGESARTADRPELQKMLAFCRSSKPDAVIVYNTSRFSRNTADYFSLRVALSKAGTRLVSVTEPFDNTPAGKLLEGVLASIAQFDNDVRTERSTDGLKAAVLAGRWPFKLAMGYVRGTDNGPPILPDTTIGPIIQELFERVASGESIFEVHRDLKNRGLRCQLKTAAKLLANPLYAGRFVVPRWNLEVKNAFPGLVSEETYLRVQSRLWKPRIVRRSYIKVRDEFPLKGFARCSCGRPLTASWSRGKRGKRYPFYRCPRSEGRQLTCVNMRVEKLHEEFRRTLDALRPKADYLAGVRQLVIEEWQNQREASAAARRRTESELSRLKEQRERLDRRFALEQSIDQETYARLRSELDDALLAGELQLHDTVIEALDLEATLAWAEQMLPKLASIWDEANSADKRRLQAAVFQHGIVVSANQIGTPVSALAFETWDLFQGAGEQLVPVRGFEPRFHG